MRSPRAVHWFAVATAVATFLLLSVGGVVTSRDAGMVFGDWPLSNGSVNPDGWLTHPDKRAEHAHRLLGALVGLMTVALAIRLHRKDGRRHVRVLGYAAVMAVSLQGLLGGLRVTESSGPLALLHGCTGQAFFALMVTLAYLTSRDAARAPARDPRLRGLLACSLAVVLTIYGQVVLGAQLRHHSGPVNSHLLGALMVAGSVVWLLTITMLRHPERATLRRPVLLLSGLLVAQVVLGFLSANAIGEPATLGYSLFRVAVPTLHQSVGALMFATSVVLALRVFLRASPAASRVEVAA